MSNIEFLRQKFNISLAEEQKARELFDKAKQLYTHSTCPPLIYPQPLCNNNLRDDAPHLPNASGSIQVGRISASKKPCALQNKLCISDIGSLVRTEELSWMDILSQSRQMALSGTYFERVFDDCVLEKISCELNSTCIGVPFGISKAILIKEESNSGGTSYLDADAVSSLTGQGAIPIGNIKSDVLGFEKDYSAEAVANGLTFALSVDNCGNTLANAAQNGVSAIRATYGLCSRMGLLCRAPSMQQMSITSRDIHDITTILTCLMKSRHNDATSYSTQLADWYKQISSLNISSRTVAIVRNSLDMRSSPCASLATIKAAELFNMLGAHVVEIDLPIPDDTLASTIIAGESRIEDILRSTCGLMQWADCTSQAKTEIVLRHLLMRDKTVLNNARSKRGELVNDLEKTLSNVSIFICPTVLDDGTPSKILNIMSLAGICALTVPCGRTSSGKRLGLLIAGRQFSEADLLGIGKLYQRTNSKLKENTVRGRRSKNAPDA